VQEKKRRKRGSKGDINSLPLKSGEELKKRINPWAEREGGK